MKTTVIPRPICGRSSTSSPSSALRLDWVDNLRTLMILLVVNMHACVTYSHVGSWYYSAPPEPTITDKIPFLEWQAHLQAFFMGLLFFIGGYYADKALGRKGVKGFLAERCHRLGLPTLLYMIAIHPLIVIVMHPGYEATQTPAREYLQYLLSGKFVGSSGPMWFAFALLLFCFAFATVSGRIPIPTSKPFQLRAVHVVGIGLVIGFASFLIRTVQPLGSSVLNFQLCYFAQYVVVFGLGIWVSRRSEANDLLDQLAASALAKKAGVSALVLGPISLIAVVMVSLPIPKSGSPAFNGGWNFIALGLAMWEQLVGVSLALGVLWFCRRYLNARTSLAGWLSERSFGVYLLHAPILVGLALLMQPHRTNPIVMAIALTIAGLLVSFGVADIARRIPLLRRIL